MGGNVTATNKVLNKNTRAEKIPLSNIGRKEFITLFTTLFKTINARFKTKFKEELWKDPSILANGFAYNGSTSFIMDPTLTDDEVIQHKKSAGDLDISFPEELKENLWELLEDFENDAAKGKEIIPTVTYMGSNKPSKSSIGDQINTVFLVDFSKGNDTLRCYCQVDFEALPYEENKPTDWAKFSHSSSFEDAKLNTNIEKTIKTLYYDESSGKFYLDDKKVKEFDKSEILGIITK